MVVSCIVDWGFVKCYFVEETLDCRKELNVESRRGLWRRKERGQGIM